ncbi:hypothetical protein [Thiohalophilus thiocyanatoxydans]|uniref:Formate hydrogenlyase subunit 3/multisubunit Na+/H+ antiporter MnhD subunit n=1 Tax=Thiohalophilus thiocyanatoxydans TaxID=381308 RepID=A0A4R8IPY5_9GAMM|nr:hypothetical protein [Thiohalophilus thiocyanatoxydans]TDY02608.1 hypothetical protein EDC23_0983 [Thiohalophilus thiocyanatoxydans]
MALLLNVLLALTLLWPIILGLLRVYPPTAYVARRLLPLTLFLPLLLVVLPGVEAVLPLPGVLLDSVLARDTTTRLFLLLIVLLLGPVMFQAPAMHGSGGRRLLFELLLLLFITALLVLVLSAGVLLFFSAATLAGYALYGMLMCGASTAGRRAGHVLVVLLVISDLVIFELLLLLAKFDVDLGFAPLRQTLAGMPDQIFLFTLMLTGFGIKAGLIGLHLWLAPVWVTARPLLRLAVLAFMLCAGLLAWLRLLPLGQLHWPAVGQVVQWLALAMSGYALITGLLQSRQAARWAHVVLLFFGLWLAVLAMLLIRPESITAFAPIWHFVLFACVPALGALALIGQYRAPATLSGFAVVNLVMAVLMLLAVVPANGGLSGMALYAGGMAVVVLAMQALTRQRVMSNAMSRGTRIAVLILLNAAALSWLAGGLRLSVETLWPAIGWLLGAALAGWLFGKLGRGRAKLPPGDILVIIRPVLNGFVGGGYWLGEVVLPRWRSVLMQRVQQGWQQLAQLAIWQVLEIRLARWETAILLLLIVALVMSVFSG